MFCTLLKDLSSRDRGTQLELQHLPKAVIRYNTEIKSHLHLFTTTDKSHLCITDWLLLVIATLMFECYCDISAVDCASYIYRTTDEKLSSLHVFHLFI